MNNKTNTVQLHKYHIHTMDECGKEEGTTTISFAVFTERIENLILGVKWINPIGSAEEIKIEDIVYIDFLGTENVELDTEMDKHLKESGVEK